MSYGTINADVIGTSVQGYSLGAGNSSLLKNKIINGAMVIDQRNAGASVTTTTANKFITDRWQTLVSVDSKFTAQQSTTAPVGFSNSLLSTSSAATTVASGDYYFIRQAIEGFNTADLNWGTANAKTVTLSFWVYSSLTGTFGGALGNSAQDRSYPFSYTVSAANTWTQISITIAGDTTGTWIGATNGIGMRINFSLGMGSTYSGTAGAWAGAYYLSATGATSVVGTNGATFYITGVQLEVGSSATGFEYRQYQQELALCQRYYQTISNANFIGSATTGLGGAVQFCVNMRTAPSFSASAALVITNPGVSDFTQSSANASLGDGTTTAAQVGLGNFTGLTQSRPYILKSTGGILLASAEL